MFILWLMIGVILGGIAFVYILRRRMIVAYKIEATFDKVNAVIKETIPEFAGWSFPIPEWQFYKSQLSKNLRYDNIKNMVMYFVCKPQHANSVLGADPSMGAIMPCTWAVYATTNGKVYIAKMNIALMSYMYFGTIGSVMRDVAKTEKEMLEKIRKGVQR